MKNRPYIIGLTGSIGMGKTTTASFFREAGLRVWDADWAVKELYQEGGAAVAPIQKIFPEVVLEGRVSRRLLKEMLRASPELLSKIEEIVHPLVAEQRNAFIATSQAEIIVLDIPLLFEVGMDQNVDCILVVSVDEQTQKQRVMARPGMTEIHFSTILKKQMPDCEKRQRADVVIETYDKAHVRKKIFDLLAEIKRKLDLA